MLFESPSTSSDGVVIRNDAVISACGLFRYELSRPVALHSGPVFAYFGVNPSTADATAEDQTTLLWRGFTLHNGGRAYLAGNAFAFRATDVRALARAADPVGPENHWRIQRIIDAADILVPCWGSTRKVPKQLREQFDVLWARLESAGKPLKTLGSTKNGSPRHPLMLSYSTPLTTVVPGSSHRH